MRLNEALFTPGSLSQFNPARYSFKILLGEKVLRVALEIFVSLCSTHFFFCTLKLQVKIVMCVSCSWLLVHMIVDCFFKWTQGPPNMFSDHDGEETGDHLKVTSEDRDFIKAFEVNSVSTEGSPLTTGSYNKPTIEEAFFDEGEYNLPPCCLLDAFNEAVYR